jgi:uncharacterized protein (DUF1800 family)
MSNRSSCPVARLSRRSLLHGLGAGLLTSAPLGLSGKAFAQPARRAGVDWDAAAAAAPVAFLDRIGWGANAAQLSELQQMGPSAYLQAQLHGQGGTALPASIAARLAALPANQPLETLIPSLIEQDRGLRRARNADADPQADAVEAEAQLKALNRFRFALAQQAASQQVLLALYAPDQLRQRLSWFWLNHFNVFRAGNVGPMMADYCQRVIAPHALGRFRDLLRATMFSPQMLLYLNNAQNARGHVNENYAREVMELHTLGVGGGYAQADVTNLARVLTGLGVDLMDRPVRVRPVLRADLWQRGLVAFNPARHDPDPKTVLGQTLQGRGLDEIDEVITLLCGHPATARHVSMQLAGYFVADHPPPALVDTMVQRWQSTDGDVAAVLHAMFTSTHFADSLQQPQFKDPMRYVLSALRASVGEEPVSNPQPVLGMLNGLGEPLFGRQTPDGYPLNAGAWDSPGQLTARFEVARQIGAGAPALYADAPAWFNQGAPQDAPAAGGMGTMRDSEMQARKPPRRALPDLARSPVYLAQQGHLSRATLQALAQADDRLRWNTLWLSSPEFMSA